MRVIGTIAGEVKPTRFDILLNADVEKGSFVKVNHPSYGWVLGRIVNSVKYVDSEEREVSLANAVAVGYRQGGRVLAPKIPLRPGERVYLADEDLIARVIGLRTQREGSIYLGLLEGHEVPIYLDPKRVVERHLCVLAKTGTGKSYAVAVMVEDLLKLDFPCVIIDPHAEYSSLKVENDDTKLMEKFGVEPHSYADKVVEYSPDPKTNPGAEKLSLEFDLELEEIVRALPLSLAEKQKEILYTTLQKLDGKEYTLDDVIRAVKHEPSASKWRLLCCLEALKDSGIFEGSAVEAKELVKKGQAVIINLRGVEPRIQQLIVAKLVGDLFKAAKLREIRPFLLLIEEAHNFCPERSFEFALSSPILRTVAAEGRKFNVHLCVVSQRPARIDKNVLSQCGTQLIMKLTNPNDLKAVGQSIEGFSPELEEEIRNLGVGQALLVGCVEQPIVVNIRARETRPVMRPARRREKEKKRIGWLDILRRIFFR